MRRRPNQQNQNNQRVAYNRSLKYAPSPQPPRVLKKIRFRNLETDLFPSDFVIFS
jgi:hypothetical protein